MQEFLEDLRDPDHYGRIPESLIYDRNAPPSAIRLYGVLDRHLNKKTKACYPGYNRIKRLTGMGKSTISKALAYLAKEGYIRIERTPQQSNRYRLMEVRGKHCPEGGVVLKQDNPFCVLKQDKGVVPKQDSKHSHINQRALNQSARSNRTVSLGEALEGLVVKKPKD